jgi:hypothetical protein
MTTWIQQHYVRFSILVLGLLSLVAWYIADIHNLTFAYNDAMSHLDLARLVVDNRQPGLSQLGSVWLPLSQLLYLPFIWDGWLWHSGVAGSLVSMVAYGFSVVGVYKLVIELSGSRLGAYVGAGVFAINLNELYLQSTPLTEPVYLGLFIFSSLYLAKYLKTSGHQFLLPLGIFTSLQVFDRYDGWFVAAIQAVILIVFELVVQKRSLQKTIGNLTFFIFPVAMAVVIWLGWNLIIFHDALYSFTGPYSAHAQQATIQKSGGLITAGNVMESLKAFGFDMRDNIGSIMLGLGALGWALYLALNRTLKTWVRTLMFSAFLSVIVFNILALYFGFSIVNVPELHWNPSGNAAGTLFNARYGILALPMVAVGVGLLSSVKHRRRAALVVISIIVLVGVQTVMMYKAGIITVEDGTKGSSAFVNGDIAGALKEKVGSDQTVLLSTSSFNAVAFQSDLPLRQFIHEGVSTEWKDAIANPDLHAQWVVMANGNTGDPVYNSLVVKEKSAFLRYFSLVYTGAHANLYEHKAASQTLTSIDDSKLVVDHQNFSIRGVNSYDLVYQSQASIAQTFSDLKSAGVNTVRFWAFGDGRSDGFQPAAGVVSEDRLKTLDYILTQATIAHIRLIPVLANNWPEYGGIDQYVAWQGLSAASHDSFYTNPQLIGLYENYLNHIITRTNTITAQTYASDPAILAWDLINEPRAVSSDPSIIAGWASQVATYIRHLDANHLVTIGTDKQVNDVALSQICAVKQIDFCSVHIYLQDQTTQLYADQAALDAEVSKYQQVAAGISKPVIISEVGVSKATVPFTQKPLNELGLILKTSVDDNYGGWLIWNWSLTPDSSFGFSPTGTAGSYTLNDLKQLVSSSR